MKYCSRGGFITGTEHIKGNSPENDTVDIKASPGEIVIDKETLAKGPKAWVDFIHQAMPSHKKNFDEGGYVNPNYQGVQNYFNPGQSPETQGYAPDIVKPSDERIRQIDAIRANLPASAFTPALQQEYNRLKAMQSQNFAEGGVVKPDLYAPPSADELKSVGAHAGLYDPPSEEELKSVGASPQPGFGERIVRGALKTLPAVGAIGAGLLATPETLGIGTIPAAAGGAVAGKSLEDTLENSIYGTGPKSYKEQAQGLAEAGIGGATQEMGGQVIPEIASGGLNLLKKGAAATNRGLAKAIGGDIEFMPKTNAVEIKAAGDRLGLDVPSAVLSSNPHYQDIEGSLSQSPTIAAKPIRDLYDNFQTGLERAGEKISDLHSGESNFSSGKQIKDNLAKQIENTQDPISKMYQDLQPHLQNIPVDQGVTNVAFGQLKKNPMFQTGEGRAMLDDWHQATAGQPELNSLRELRQSLDGSLSPNSSPQDAARVSALRNTITKVRDNSIEALKSSMPSGAHSEIEKLGNDLALADAAHSSHIGDLNAIKSIVGGKEVGSPTEFLRRLDNLSEEQIAKRAGDLGVSDLESIQKYDPQTFAKIKQSSLNDIINSSVGKNQQFDTNKFLKQYNKLNPETRDMLIDPAVQSHIKDIQTVKNEIPNQVGPSGTPHGLGYKEGFEPLKAVTGNFKDLTARNVIYNSKIPGSDVVAPAISPAVSPPVAKLPAALQLFKGAENTSQAIPKAASNNNSFKKMSDLKGDNQ